MISSLLLPGHAYARAECECCRIASERARAGTLHALGCDWTLNAEGGGTNRPRLIVQARRHVPDLADLQSEEAMALGLLLPVLVAALTTVTGAERVYVIYLNETTPRHVHLRLVPRFRDDPDSDWGVGILYCPLVEGHAAPSADEVAAAVADIANADEPTRRRAA